MAKNVLIDKNFEAIICDIQKHFDLAIFEFNSISSQILANSMQSRNQIRVIFWMWHLRLEHCRLKVIDQLKKYEGLKIIKINDTAFKTVNCTTCAVSKMHQLINQNLIDRATKPYQVLHFDLTILNKGFDETSCIAHFTDEFISFNWVFPLINHKEKTLMPMFKSVINKCDRADLSINSVVFTIRTGQKTFIESDLKNWVLDQSIDWNWTVKNTSEQNEISKRYEGLLTEKTKCICFHAKFSENLYPECYLIAVYLMNRTSNKSLKWTSPLMALQKHFDQSIKHKITHLKIYECKAYPVLKEKNKSFKNHKMKPRTFIGYLIKYDSFNIFRVWNLEKSTVNGYKNVIFNENELFDSYEEKNLIKKTQRSEFVKFEIFNLRPTVQLNDGDEDWMNLPIRKRVEELSQTQSEKVMKNFDDDENDQSMISKQSTTPRQLKTSDNTLFMTSNQDNQNDISVTILVWQDRRITDLTARPIWNGSRRSRVSRMSWTHEARGRAEWAESDEWIYIKTRNFLWILCSTQ